MIWLQAILDSQDHGVNALKLLVATTLEICEGICRILRCLCLSKKSLLSPSWSPLTITDLCIPMVFNFHGLRHRPPTF
jgi:hypothetical protein